MRRHVGLESESRGFLIERVDHPDREVHARALWRAAACRRSREGTVSAAGTSVALGAAPAEAGEELGEELIDHQRLGDARDDPQRAVAG